MKESYLKPQAEVLILSAIQLICGSPNPGENESIQYEDWGV